MMFVLGFILGAGLTAVVATCLFWWWTLPTSTSTAFDARQAIWEIERRTVQALLREDSAATVAQHIEGTASDVEPS